MKGMRHHLEIEELEIVAQKMIEKFEFDKILCYVCQKGRPHDNHDIQK